MALGGVFLIPSPRNFLLATLAVCASPLLLEATQVSRGASNGFSVYALPFNVVTLFFLYMAGSIGYPGVAKQIGAIPEDTLNAELIRRNRFHGGARTVRLPFFGNWTVWQQFDDDWTHKGIWRYAYDFVIADDQGRTHIETGDQLEDYYCYRKPILSPSRGRVSLVVNDLPDNPIGGIDRDHNWGNQVVIQDERGFYVQLSHFATGSIRVHEGEWVVPGTVLGQCGNSGYSPQPHLHIQAQPGVDPNEGTVPFSFVAYLCDHVYHANDLPRKNAEVQPIQTDLQLDLLTDFILNEKFVYELVHNGRFVRSSTLNVQMAPDGTFYFQSDAGARLYFGKHEGTFYFYKLEGDDPILRLLFLAIPRLPLAFATGIEWYDVSPIAVAATGITRALAQSASSIWPGLSQIQVAMKFRHRGLIETEIVSKPLSVHHRFHTQIGEVKGIASIDGEGWKLRRTSYETT